MLKIVVALFSITLVLWQMDVELDNVLALVEGILLLVIFGGKKKNIFRQADKLLRNSYSHLFLISVAKFFNFALTNCAFLCFLTAAKIPFTTELKN